MKVNLKKMLGLAALGMTLLTNTAPTWAGYKDNREVLREPVGINGVSGFYVTGSMVSARYSTDSNQNIGCTAYALGTYTWTACFATDKAGNSLVCGSSDPRWAEAVQSMTDSSFISFTVTDNDGDCKFVGVKSGSDLLR